MEEVWKSFGGRNVGLVWGGGFDNNNNFHKRADDQPL